MGVLLKSRHNRVTKRIATPKKASTESFQAKLVQSHACDKSLCSSSANKPQSPLNCALQEALKCTECADLHITPYMMEADISAGSYITTHYPPHFAFKNVQDDEISPFDTEPQQTDKTFWQDISLPQQQQYLDKVDALIKKAGADSSNPVDEATVLFAHYQVDFHIRQHHLNPRSFFNICHSKAEIADLHDWEWKVAEADGTNLVEDPDWGVGWKHEPSNSLGHQIAAWQKGQRARVEHLAEVRAQWALIQEERRKQRMRTVHFVFKGRHVRTFMYEPVASLLAEEEVVGIARRFADRFLMQHS